MRQRIDVLFAIEREIRGAPTAERRSVRQAKAAPVVAALEAWMTQTRDKLSGGHDLAKALNYMLRRWPSFTRFLKRGVSDTLDPEFDLGHRHPG